MLHKYNGMKCKLKQEACSFHLIFFPKWRALNARTSILNEQDRVRGVMRWHGFISRTPFYFSMWSKCVWGPQMSSLSLVYCLQSDLWIFSLWTPGAVTCGFNVEFRACELFWYCAHISPLACMCGSRVASQSHVSQFLPDCHHFRKGFLFKLQIRSSILTYNWQLCRKCLHHFVVKLEKQNNNVFFVCCTLKWCHFWKQREAFLLPPSLFLFVFCLLVF